jgi:hypothetical protein
MQKIVHYLAVVKTVLRCVHRTSLKEVFMASHSPVPPPKDLFVAFVVQGEDVFKITSDSIVHTWGNSAEAAFQGIAKLRAAVALEQLTAIHNERPDVLHRMAQEVAREGITMLARTSHPAKPNLEKIA